MAGGIRDIEFVVQALQLINGGKNAAVRERNTLKALQALRQHNLLAAGEEETLTRSYVLYRTIEHRLQMMLNTQTHTLPDDPQEREKLGRGLGFRSIDEFQETLSAHLSGVKSVVRPDPCRTRHFDVDRDRCDS